MPATATQHGLASLDLSEGDRGALNATPNPGDSRAKPALSPPEIRRKITEEETRGQKLAKEWSKDFAEDFSEEHLKQLDEIDGRVKVLKRQLEAAERWYAVDGALGREQRGRISDRMPMPHDDPLNTRNGRHQYSLLKVFRHRMDPGKYPLDGIELETTQELFKERQKSGVQRESRAFPIPNDLPIDLRASYRYARRAGMGGQAISDMIAMRRNLQEQRALDTTAGAGSIPTIVDTTMIELLRPRMVTYGLGARFMIDMQGLFAIPRQSSAATFYMVAQGGSVTASNQTIDQVPFSPHTGGAYTTYTRQFLEQTNQDAEMFVREDQVAVVARGVETAALNGQAALGWPMGIAQNPQIAVYAIGANGGAPTWTQLISMIAYVAYFNADAGNLGFICDALTRGTLQITPKIANSTFPIYLWNTEAPDWPVAGHVCPVTNLLPQNITKGSGTNLHMMIFGNWEDVVYAFWSGMDVIVDPYTAAAQGAVNIVTLQDFDVNVRHYQSFANCIDIVSSIAAPIT
jgi:Phage capsid family